jgi:hypothetical protein
MAQPGRRSPTRRYRPQAIYAADHQRQEATEEGNGNYDKPDDIDQGVNDNWGDVDVVDGCM